MLRSISSKRLFSSHQYIHRNTPNNNPSIPFTFTPENLSRAKALILQYPPQYKKAAVIPVLDLAQRQNDNFTSISAMNAVAELLEMPPMRVYEVATFYTMYNREPVGKYFLQICTTTPCMLCGAYDILKTVETELGITAGGPVSNDGLFSLVEVECAGACVNAPVMSVNDDYYEDLTDKSTIELLRAIKAGKSVPPGPQGGVRKNCENSAGKTNLKGEVPGAGFGVRADL